MNESQKWYLMNRFLIDEINGTSTIKPKKAKFIPKLQVITTRSTKPKEDVANTTCEFVFMARLSYL
jgi:hypothetical protein